MTGAKDPTTISTKLERIAEQARRLPELTFTSLNQYLDLDLLHTAFKRLNRRAAPGVDGITYKEYEDGLDDRLKDLLERAKSGTYRAPPVKRKHIPKGSGPETRPIGIPTLEDRIVQQAVRMILEEVYEQDFYPCSYGFRRRKSAHDALEDLWRAIPRQGCWILDVDIRKFFDTLDHGQLKELLNLRVRDGVIRRLLHKWLHAGVLEDGSLSYPEAGTPQGGVISPLLANVYLHEVLDKWFHREVMPRLRGRAFLIRYADDFVMGFDLEEDARRVLDVLPKRFGKYGLTIHPDKTRLIDFRRRERKPKGPPDVSPEPATFDFLSFTHHWGRSKRGKPWVVRKTSRKRFVRAVATLTDWCRTHRHWAVKDQAEALGRKLRGHDQYFGITGNYPALARIRRVLERIWRYWLDRRSEKRLMPWPRFKRLLARYPLPRPRVCHSVFRSAAPRPVPVA